MAEHKSRDCLHKGVQVAGLEAARPGQIHLGDVVGDIVGLPLLSIARRLRACCRGSQTLSKVHLARRDFSTGLPLSIWSAAGSSFTCFASSRQVSRSEEHTSELQ